MAPYAQDGSISVTSATTLTSTMTPVISYSTKGSKPSSISSITSIPSSFSTATATPTYISKGSPAPTQTSLRGSQPPSKWAIQDSTLAFIIVLTLLLGIALGVVSWKKGWGFRHTVVTPSAQHPKPPMYRKNDSNATLVDESSPRRHGGERSVAVETCEVRFERGGRGSRVESSVVNIPEKTMRAGTVS